MWCLLDVCFARPRLYIYIYIYTHTHEIYIIIYIYIYMHIVIGGRRLRRQARAGQAEQRRGGRGERPARGPVDTNTSRSVFVHRHRY